MKRTTLQIESIIEKVAERFDNHTGSKRVNIADTVLAATALAGLISLVILAPNVIRLLGAPHKDKKRPVGVADVRRATLRLAEKGFVKLRSVRGEKYIELTDAGKQKMLESRLTSLLPLGTTRWDGKWRLVIFDVPQAAHLTRNRLRRSLQHAGLVQIQKSVYMTPFECYDFVTMLREVYKLGSFVTYAIVEKIENDELYRKRFGLVK